MSRSSGLDAILHRPPPSTWDLFWQKPIIFLTQALYQWRKPIPRPPFSTPVTVICLSDTHNQQPSTQLAWLRQQPHPVKVVVAGNHDLLLDAHQDGKGGQSPVQRAQLDWGDILYLENASAKVICANGRTFCIYGSPQTPRHGNWAFQYPRGDVDVWTNRVPDETDILITHSPPAAHLDLRGMGCKHLLRELWRVKPRLHVFGHVHAGRGVEAIGFDALQAACERVIVQKGGIGNLLRVLGAFVLSFASQPMQAKSMLVNCAVVGGLRDELRREPMKVVI